MQVKKNLVAKLIGLSLCAVVVVFAIFLPIMQNNDVKQVGAANGSVTINFSGFDAETISPYAVVSFVATDGTITSTLLTTSGTKATAPTDFIGKVEVNFPMYSTITSSSAEAIGTGASFASYYFTGDMSLTITFSDKGWFAGTTIV